MKAFFCLQVLVARQRARVLQPRVLQPQGQVRQSQAFQFFFVFFYITFCVEIGVADLFSAPGRRPSPPAGKLRKKRAICGDAQVAQARLDPVLVRRPPPQRPGPGLAPLRWGGGRGSRLHRRTEGGNKRLWGRKSQNQRGRRRTGATGAQRFLCGRSSPVGRGSRAVPKPRARRPIKTHRRSSSRSSSGSGRRLGHLGHRRGLLRGHRSAAALGERTGVRGDERRPKGRGARCRRAAESGPLAIKAASARRAEEIPRPLPPAPVGTRTGEPRAGRPRAARAGAGARPTARGTGETQSSEKTGTSPQHRPDATGFALNPSPYGSRRRAFESAAWFIRSIACKVKVRACALHAPHGARCCSRLF